MRGRTSCPPASASRLDARDHQLSTPAAAWDVTRLLTNFPALEGDAPAPAAELGSPPSSESILRGELEGLRDVLAYDGTVRG